MIEKGAAGTWKGRENSLKQKARPPLPAPSEVMDAQEGTGGYTRNGLMLACISSRTIICEVTLKAGLLLILL
jgi:hypothetical protein